MNHDYLILYIIDSTAMTLSVSQIPTPTTPQRGDDFSPFINLSHDNKHQMLLESLLHIRSDK